MTPRHLALAIALAVATGFAAIAAAPAPNAPAKFVQIVPAGQRYDALDENGAIWRLEPVTLPGDDYPVYRATPVRVVVAPPPKP